MSNWEHSITTTPFSLAKVEQGVEALQMAPTKDTNQVLRLKKGYLMVPLPLSRCSPRMEIMREQQLI